MMGPQRMAWGKKSVPLGRESSVPKLYITRTIITDGRKQEGAPTPNVVAALQAVTAARSDGPIQKHIDLLARAASQS